MVVAHRIQRGTYQDSVKLMRISVSGGERGGVEIAVAVMGTENNLKNLQDTGFDKEIATSVSPNDLILAVRAKTKRIANDALDSMEKMISSSLSKETEEGIRPRTLQSALGMQPEANFALISVPGPFARREAESALNAGLHCMVFSDNVSLEDEVFLKTVAGNKNLLFMGPDCGTAIIGNRALAFANVVSRGDVGIVGASGTGIQAISVLIDRLGGGISHAIGTGGRDLSKEVEGRSMLQGIRMLGGDKSTKVLLLVSKPSDSGVMKRVLEAAAETGKPTVGIFLGGDPKVTNVAGVHPADNLEEAAQIAVALTRGETAKPSGENHHLNFSRWVEAERSALNPGQRYVRGLYSGGTLCEEAILILSQSIGNINSNISKQKGLALQDPNHSIAHTVVDLGEDFFTRGRPHPMIDPTLRNNRILQEAEDPGTAVLLLDVILGYGSHEDPGGATAGAISEAKNIARKSRRGLTVVASVCGTERDPQVLSEQNAALAKAGARVFSSNTQAAMFAAMLVEAIAS